MEELNPFKITQKQLDKAAELMGLDEQAHALLREPMRSITVNIPVKMDDGKTRLFNGFRVQYNNARGPYKGGIRFHPQENIDTVKALAAWMTWKTSLANIPFGGGKGGVICDPKSMSNAEVERLSRGYIRALRNDIGTHIDVPAPDVYTNPQIMSWIMDEYSKLVGHDEFSMITGKPTEVWGSEGRFNSTAMGGMYILRESAKLLGIKLNGATVAIQGFGNAGAFAFQLAAQLGCKVVAVTDSEGGTFSASGLRFDDISAEKGRSGHVSDYKDGKKISNEELLESDVDVLIPAAIENQITGKNADRIKAKVVLELANGPVTPEADRILLEKNILDMPDFLVNSGGVIVSYFEWSQNLQGYYWGADEVYAKLDRIMTRSFNDIISTQKSYRDKSIKITPRDAAYIIAVDRVAKAMKLRGWY